MEDGRGIVVIVRKQYIFILLYIIGTSYILIKNILYVFTIVYHVSQSVEKDVLHETTLNKSNDIRLISSQ